ncbi:MAG: diaminopimelate decarboxylase [Actinomycetota bacterium]
MPEPAEVADRLRARSDATAFSAWPSNATFTERGLEVAGISAVDLASRYGTPLLVVDEDDLRARCRLMRSLFPRVLYAVKAFTAYALLRVVAEEGIDLLVSSEGELEAAVRAGIRGDRIVFHGNNKSDRELTAAVGHGVALIIVDNRDEVDRVAREANRAGLLQRVLLRVVPEVAARTHPAIETGAKGSKFGTPLSDAVETATAIEADPSLHLEGIHAHIGSQVLDVGPYLQTVDTLLDLLETLQRQIGTSVRLLDVGGGFGVTYADERPLVVQELAEAVMERVRAGAQARGLPVPRVAVEPGRSLVANTTLTLYRTGSRKHVPDGPVLLAVDGGMSDNIRPMLYGARFSVVAAGPQISGPRGPVTIVGRHCESGDVLAHGVTLPIGLPPGSLLAFAATGAYTYSMASTYNRVGRPAVVAVREGTSACWVRREDVADLDRLEVMPSGPIPEVASPVGVRIRPAEPRDARSFLELWRAVVADGIYVRTEQVRGSARVYRRRFRAAQNDRELWLVAVEGSRVVGNLHIQREEHPVTRHVATLGLAVVADRRGRGIGSALMADALRWAERSGVEKVELSVYPTNTPAIALYRRFGFVDEGRLVRQSRKAYGYEDEILMARWL